MTFLAINIAGNLFSIVACAFREKFDIFASIVYAIIMASRSPLFVLRENYAPTRHCAFPQVEDITIMIAALVLNPIARRERAAQAFDRRGPMSEVSTNLSSSTGGSRNLTSDWTADSWAWTLLANMAFSRFL